MNLLISASFLVVCVVSTVYSNADNIHGKQANPFFLHTSCAEILQHQINEEMHASLVYQNMASHFNTLSVSRKGFHKFFEDSSKEEREHAKKFMDYVTTRGGTNKPLKIKMPEVSRYNNALDALESALELEEHVNKKILEVHEKANKICDDAHLMDFLEHEFINEQVESISQLKRYIAILTAMDSGMGEYLLDKELNGEKIEL